MVEEKNESQVTEGSGREWGHDPTVEDEKHEGRVVRVDDRVESGQTTLTNELVDHRSDLRF